VREALALSADETGRYQVLLVPRHRPGAPPRTATGSVKLSAFGQHRSFPFAASGAPVRVAELDLRWRSRLERR
jgi:hypothetical protein